MIVQERDGGLLLFRQTDHALLSGAFASAWGNERFPAPARRDETLVAAARHDDGWAEWELAPKTLTDGRPVDFIRIPVAEHVDLYRRGIDLVEAEDPYAGLLASLHGERLYTRPFVPGMEPRLNRLTGGDLELAHAYVEGEHARQERLIAADGDTEAAEETWRLLQVWDRLSLLVCMHPLRDGTRGTMPPVAAAAGDVQIQAWATDAGELHLEPFPFGGPVAFEVEAFVVDDRTWPDVRAFRLAFRSAEREILRFTCRPA